MDLQLGLFPDDPAAAPRSAVGPAPAPPKLRDTAERLPPTLRMGTSSWSFPGWDGIVYDRPASQAVLARHGLEAYALHPLLRTVGVDRTFYRPLSAEDFALYADVVPPDFRFLVKAHRGVTSPTDPESPSVRTANPDFLDPLRAVEDTVAPAWEGLGPKLGPILFQLPPVPVRAVGGTDAFAERLHRFLDALPDGPRYAVELRTPALLTPAYAEALEAAGAAHCYSVHPATIPIEEQLRRISPFYQPALVVRWMLHAGLRYEAAKDRYAPFDRLVDEDPAARERIAVAVLDATLAERDAFVIASNKAEGSAPLSIVRLAERIATWRPETGDDPKTDDLATDDAP